MQKSIKNRRAVTTIGFLAIAGILTVAMLAANFSAQQVTAAPANKVGFSSNTLSVTGTSGEDTLATVYIQLGENTDAIIDFHEECSLYTTVNLENKGGKKGTQQGSATAQQDVYLVIDGVKVDGSDVTMCKRTHTISTNILSQIQELCSDVDDLQNATGTDDGEECDPSVFSDYLETKAAHGWGWIVTEADFDSSVKDHEIKVMGVISGGTDDVNNDAVSDYMAAVGKVSLIVDPENLANGS